MCPLHPDPVQLLAAVQALVADGETLLQSAGCLARTATKPGWAVRTVATPASLPAPKRRPRTWQPAPWEATSAGWTRRLEPPGPASCAGPPAGVR